MILCVGCQLAMIGKADACSRGDVEVEPASAMALSLAIGAPATEKALE